MLAQRLVYYEWRGDLKTLNCRPQFVTFVAAIFLKLNPICGFSPTRRLNRRIHHINRSRDHIYIYTLINTVKFHCGDAFVCFRTILQYNYQWIFFKCVGSSVNQVLVNHGNQVMSRVINELGCLQHVRTLLCVNHCTYYMS